MVDYTSIENTLKRLDTEYTAQIADPQMPILFSKLALIEFCGWIEESFDTILYEYIDRRIIDNTCKTMIKKIILKNYGFKYENHIFKMVSTVLGVNNWENIIDTLSYVDQQNFENLLMRYSEGRNKAAHTHTPIGTTTSFNSPSIVLNDFYKIKSIIYILEQEIQAL